MAKIGIVERGSYKDRDGKVVPLVNMDIRTLSIRKKFTISVNKLKYPDGVVNGNIAQGKEEHPDYHIWTSLANRGESGWSEMVGSVRDAVSDNGLKYKRAVLFDPFIQKENIYFTLFSVDEDKKRDANHLYNVVAQPYRRMDNTQSHEQQAQPSYEPQASYAKADGTKIPMTTESIEADSDEIPF